MKLGCSSWSHNQKFKDGSLDLFDWMGICARDLKVDGIEIVNEHMDSLDEDYVKTVRRLSVDLHLTISALAMFNDFGLLSSEARDAEMEKVEMECKVAAALGAPIVRVFAGWPEGDRDEQWDEMVRCMKVSCMIAEREGVVLAVENINHGGFIRTRKDVTRLMEDVDSNWLRLNLDTGNFEDGFESIEKSLVYAVHAHAKMKIAGPDGADAEIDYPAIASLMKSANYRGFVSLEYEGAEDAETAVPRCAEYLRKILS